MSTLEVNNLYSKASCGTDIRSTTYKQSNHNVK
jgi:hypothetical protein